MLLELPDTYRPLIEPAWLAGLLLSAGIVIAWLTLRQPEPRAMSRRVAILVLRLLALAGLGWVLGGPSVTQSTDQPADAAPIVELLVDTSATMAHRDVVRDQADPPLTRWDALQQSWLSPELFDALDTRGPLALHTFTHSAHRVQPAELADIEPQGQRTHLWRVLTERAAAADTPRLILLLSDGADTQQRYDAQAVQQLIDANVAVDVVPVGRADAAPSLLVQSWADADFLFDGQQTTLHAHLHQRGYDRPSATVQLLHEGQPIDQQRIDFAPDQLSQPLSFDIQPPGPQADAHAVRLHHYTLRVELHDRDDDAPAAVREHELFVQVCDEPIRVLLLEGEPGWESRFLAQQLREDPAVDLLTAYAFSAQRRNVIDARADAFAFDPDAIDAQALAPFDIVVLGKRLERFFTPEQADALDTFVQQQGGALVLARGNPFSDTEPGRAARDQARLDLSSTQQPIPAESLDALAAHLHQAGPGTPAQWMDPNGRRLSLTLHARGNGHILNLQGDNLWRQAMRGQDAPRYATFWSQAIHHLIADSPFTPGRDIALRINPTQAQLGTPVRIELTTRAPEPDFQPRIELHDPTGQSQSLHPSPTDATHRRFTIQYTPEHQGIHELTVTDRGDVQRIEPTNPITARFAVRDSSLDAFDAAARPRVLERLAHDTGGHRYALDDRDAWLAQLDDRLQAFSQTTRTAEQRQYSFARWPVLALILLCLLLAWALQRHGLDEPRP